jgi:hypothetical protein
MYTDDKSATAPVRRRIIQQPLRTEAAYALIAADAAQTGELEARLKRDRPLITFPSISHFLAEPVRREPWAAVVVARAGAWDPRFDSHVRRRRAIALFALAEEVYSWPEAVARVRDLTELGAWLESLDAPEPAPIKRAVKRETRTQAKAALSELGASWLQPRARVAAAAEIRREEPAALAGAVTANESVLPPPAAPARLKAKARTVPPQAQPGSARPKSDLSLARVSERVDGKTQGSAARKTRSTLLSAPELAAASSSPASEAANRKFIRLAAELGLVRARELLDELRERTTRLARTLRSP